MSQRKEKKEYNVFVTVGTTKFEKFIRVFDTEEILTYNRIIGKWRLMTRQKIDL